MPVRNTSVRDARSNVEHDDCALALNAKKIEKNNKKDVTRRLKNWAKISQEV